MPEKSEVIRRLRAGQSIREINRETGIHGVTIRLLKELAIIHDFLAQRGVELSETSVRRYIHRKFPGQFRRPVTLRETRSGEILEVDYGYFGLTTCSCVTHFYFYPLLKPRWSRIFLRL